MSCESCPFSHFRPKPFTVCRFAILFLNACMQVRLGVHGFRSSHILVLNSYFVFIQILKLIVPYLALQVMVRSARTFLPRNFHSVEDITWFEKVVFYSDVRPYFIRFRYP